MMKIRKYKIECKKSRNKSVTTWFSQVYVFDISKKYTNRKTCQANTRQTTIKQCVVSLRLKKEFRAKTYGD